MVAEPDRPELFRDILAITHETQLSESGKRSLDEIFFWRSYRLSKLLIFAISKATNQNLHMSVICPICQPRDEIIPGQIRRYMRFEGVVDLVLYNALG